MNESVDFFGKVFETYETTKKLLLPSLPEEFSKDVWVAYQKSLIEVMTFASIKTKVWLQLFVQLVFVEIDRPNEYFQEFVQAKAMYDQLEEYFIDCCASKTWLNHIIEYTYKSKKQAAGIDEACKKNIQQEGAYGVDKRKSTIATHVMWELMKLRVIVNISKMRLVTKKVSAQDFPSLIEMDLINGNLEKPILEYTQSEIMQCYFKLSRSLNFIPFSCELELYLNLLMDRTAMFFCCSFNDNSLNVQTMRQKDNSMNTMNEEPVTTKFFLRSHTSDVDTIEKVNKPYYSISFEFVYYAQLYFYALVSKIRLLEERPKIPQNYFSTQLLGHVWIDDILNAQNLRDATIDKAFVAASELREAYEAEYLKQCIFHTEKTIYFKDHLGSADTMMDINLIQKIYPSTHIQLIEKSKRPLHKVVMEDENLTCQSGMFEWLVLKLLNGVFGSEFNFYEKYVYNHQKLMENLEEVRYSKHPLIVQWCSRFYVYFQNVLYIDNEHVINALKMKEVYNHDLLTYFNLVKNSTKVNKVQTQENRKYLKFTMDDKSWIHKDKEFVNRQNITITIPTLKKQCIWETEDEEKTIKYSLEQFINSYRKGDSITQAFKINIYDVVFFWLKIVAFQELDENKSRILASVVRKIRGKDNTQRSVPKQDNNKLIFSS